jgi:hypothetical protein
VEAIHNAELGVYQGGVAGWKFYTYIGRRLLFDSKEAVK